MKPTVTLSFVLLALVACVTSFAAAAPAAGQRARIAAAIANPARPASDRADDPVRDPADTLAFAGVRPGMVVAELFPGGGYFTRLLSDVVGRRGKVIGLENAGWTESAEADRKLLAEPGRGNVSLDVEPFGQFKLPGRVDLFWITQNYHDLHIAKYGVVDTAEFNRRVFAALKPGGVYFILDHEAESGLTDARIAALHRIDKARVIAEVTAAGFRLADEGRFLNRPGDDHFRSIFDPAIRGHTDQYALKFVRPASPRKAP
jgi:predicted methyltransferase